MSVVSDLCLRSGPKKCQYIISTRDIAEGCNMDIYQARYFLLKLKSKGVVVNRKCLKTRALYWGLVN
ncbi:FaeA/PapI family transcriptional regulator [Klebsiella aerogenes]|uniref:FaeA/PapI family transcriptional regulator n=1 Tax=Klebsiella aerogenes TaxID=548 RepID=UPI00398C1B5C